jgi:hypothetical protein
MRVANREKEAIVIAVTPGTGGTVKNYLRLCESGAMETRRL